MYATLKGFHHSLNLVCLISGHISESNGEQEAADPPDPAKRKNRLLSLIDDETRLYATEMSRDQYVRTDCVIFCSVVINQFADDVHLESRSLLYRRTHSIEHLDLAPSSHASNWDNNGAFLVIV